MVSSRAMLVLLTVGRLSPSVGSVSVAGSAYLASLDCRPTTTLLRSSVKTGELAVAREQRKLAAILAADAVGYSRLMGRDESGALARLLKTVPNLFLPTKEIA